MSRDTWRERLRDPLGRIGAIKLKLGALLIGGAIASVGAGMLAAQLLGRPWWIPTAIGFAVAVVLVDLLGTGLTAPLRQMAEQAERLADGQPVAHVDDHARDEVGALARAFNRMAREVAHTDRLRRELVANVSHELRTPLAAMSAVVENLVDGVEEPTPDSLGRLEAQTGRLRRLVDQLLDLSQLDAGSVVLDRVPVATAAVVADAVAACGDEADRRVQTAIAGDAAVLEVDPDRFRQVLVNLVDNALRHGPDNTPVRVEAHRDGHEIVLVVSDEGPGIRPADAEHVFQRFARSDHGRALAEGGAGLGLPIARWVVALHGGTLTVQPHDGPGTRMCVRVPSRPSPTGEAIAPAAPAAVAAPAGVLAAGPDHGAVAASSSPSAPPGATSDASLSTSQEPAVSVTDPHVPPPPVSSGGSSDMPPAPPSPPSSSGGFELLPTPVAGFPTRSLVAVGAAAVVAALLGVLPLEGAELDAGLAMTLWLGTIGLASVAGLERRLDPFGWVCVASALGMAAAWTWTDAAWVLWPGTFVVAIVAGLGLWGPSRAGEVLRALVVGPLLAFATPIAIGRGLRGQRRDRMREVVVPVLGVVIVLVVFGGLLTGGDAAFGALVDAVLPDLSLDEYVVARIVLAGVAAATVATYLLVARAGTVETTPWRRPVRPRRDWLAPVLALDALLLLAIVVRAGVLFGGEERVLATTGLTYAEYAREGFGSLLALATMVLVVTGIVARVAADEDRVVRDRALAVLLAATGLVVVSAVQRLALYTAQFGLTRLRFSAFVAIGFVAVVIVLVAVAGRSTAVASALPRVLVALVGVTVLGVALARPDAIIARQQVAAFAGTDQLDVGYVTSLSADAAPALAGLGDDLLTATLDEGYLTVDSAKDSFCGTVHGVDEEERWATWNAARSRAQRATADVPVCQVVVR